MSPAATKKSETKQAATKKGAANKAAATRARTPQRKKDTSKLTGRLAEDFVALHSLQEARARRSRCAKGWSEDHEGESRGEARRTNSRCRRWRQQPGHTAAQGPR